MKEFHTKHLDHYKDIEPIQAIKNRQTQAIKNLPTGNGIEHGALFWPTPLTPNHKILYSDIVFEKFYSDKMPPPDQSKGFVDIDIEINDFENLSAIDKMTQKVDFFIANHVLEHVPKPVSFLRSIHSILKANGVLMLTVPDATKIYDKSRPRFTLTDAIISELDPCLHKSKIMEYIIEVEKLSEETNILNRVLKIIAHKEDPHLWTFDRITYQLVISKIIDHFNFNFAIIDTYYNAPFEEMTLFLRKLH